MNRFILAGIVQHFLSSVVDGKTMQEHGYEMYHAPSIDLITNPKYPCILMGDYNFEIQERDIMFCSMDIDFFVKVKQNQEVGGVLEYYTHIGIMSELTRKIFNHTDIVVEVESSSPFEINIIDAHVSNETQTELTSDKVTKNLKLDFQVHNSSKILKKI